MILKIFPFLCILLSSVAAIDFDSKYRPDGHRLLLKFRDKDLDFTFSDIVYASNFFSLSIFIFILHFSLFSSQVQARFLQQ